MDFKQNCALLLIDLQKGFENIEFWGGGRNNPRAKENAGRTLTSWRDKKFPYVSY